jgi:hypothetical protein
MRRRLSNFFLLLAICCSIHPIVAQHPTRPRIIITADPELDDNNSLIRFLLYSSDFTVEGLVYASSQFHWKGDGKGTKWFVPGREYDRFGMGACPCTSWRWAENERFIHDIVEAYEKVYPNLKIHNANYPTPDYLKSKIRYGNIEFDGDYSKDTPGSILIRNAIMDDKPGQLFISAWGGHSTIARALKSIQDLYENTIEWEQIKKKIARKVVLLPSGDQDDTYTSYIKPHWPEIEYRQFREGPNYGYGAQIRANADNAGYLTPAWMKENVNDRGPLGSLYRVWGDGKQMVKGDKVDYFGLAGYSNEELKKMGYFVWMPVQEKGSWLGEGDNHTFMNMLGNGLRAYEKASFGGWGGRERAQKEELSLFAMPVEDNADSLAKRIEAANVQNSAIDVPYPNFFPQAQRDFAARMKWTVSKTYQEANHEPQVKIAGPLVLMVGKGQKVKLHAEVYDPDGQQVSVKWWPFYVGTYPSKVEILNANALNAEIVIPNNAVGGQTIHVILEASDNGSPALTRYQRVILVLAQR